MAQYQGGQLDTECADVTKKDKGQRTVLFIFILFI